MHSGDQRLCYPHLRAHVLSFVEVEVLQSLEVTVVRFESLTAAQLAADQAWWRIFAEAFSPDSQEPPAVIVSAVGSGVGLAVSAQLGGETVGLASLHLLLDPPVVVRG